MKTDKLKMIVMINMRIIGLICILFLINGCINKDAEMKKSEIVKVISSSNDWFIESKEKWFDRDEIESGWNDSILLGWIIESNYFSNNYIEKLELDVDNDKHFGLYFYDYQGLGKMLKALCDDDENEIINGIKKISKDKYRYITPFYNVLNSIPDPNYDEKYLWMWETGDDGKKWYFSIILIKENDMWVIDKFERWYTKIDN